MLSIRKNKTKVDYNSSSSTLNSSSSSTTTIITSSSYHSSSGHHSRKNTSKLTPNANDTIIQKSLKLLKRLEIEISKFNSKTNGVTKTNILRTSLLPFLRDPNCDLSTQIQDRKIYLSLVSISSNVLLRWWRVLLTSLTLKNNPTKSPVISSTDRNAYLEGISRIISRKEWLDVDPETYAKFQGLLTITLDYSIDKVQVLKILPLSIGAFIGKVFAYSYFHLPMVSDALLFLLNVKQYMFEDTMEAMDKTLQKTNRQTIHTILKAFPSHLGQFHGVGHLLLKKQKFFINSVPPPKHPVKGISDPNGSWVRRWCSSDSDIFNSFFRHYISITNTFLFENKNDDEYNEDGNSSGSEVDSETGLERQQRKIWSHYDYDTLLMNAPGFKVILSHILHIFQVSITRISQNNPSTFNNMFFKQDSNSGSKESMISTQSMNDIYYNSIVKILKTCRDLKFSNIVNLSRCLIKYIDRLFISIAMKTSIYDYNKNGLLLNIVYEFINYVDNDINWEFWLSSSYLMISKTDHIQVLLKNFAFLFNVWDLISSRYTTINDNNQTVSFDNGWLTKKHETLKWNFANWLVSSPIWSTFFNHWEPIIRTYYLKLIIWRLIGINNHSRNYSLSIENHIDQNLKYSYDYLCCKRGKSRTILLKPDNPLVNRKFSIIPNTMKEDMFPRMEGEIPSSTKTNNSSNELRKTHPYEIFDEAIYSCSSLPSSPIPNYSNDRDGDDDDDDDGDANYVESQGRSSSLLVSSLGKILKILSTDDKRVMEAATTSPSSTTILSAPPSIGGGPSGRISSLKSVSATSLSNSIKSGSSSPSIMSTYSTSFTDFSTESSIKSDSSSSNASSVNLADLIQPPELLTRPPNIVRPLYRFEIVIDTKAINEKLSMNRGQEFGNSRVVTRSKYLRLPKYPKIPSFAKFYEMLFCDEAYIQADKERDRDGPMGGNIFEEEVGEEDSFEDELLIKPKVSHNPLYPDSDLRRILSYNWVNIGKSLNEWNEIVEEFEKFMSSKVEDFKTKSNDNYEVYFKRSIPFLSVDSASELKFLNAG